MASIFRGAAVYLMLLLIFRIAGKRTLSDVTTFDFVLILIISEVVQQGMIGRDNSLTNAFLLVFTLVGLNILISVLKQRWPRLEALLEGRPVIIFDRGKPLREMLDRERVGEEDILHAARAAHGLAQLSEIETAVLEPSGGISVIPKDNTGLTQSNAPVTPTKHPTR